MKKLLVFALAILVAGSLWAAGSQEDVRAASADSPITIKLGHVTSTVEPIGQAFEFYAKQVYERTDGRVIIEVYPGGALGTNKEMYEQARVGASVIANVDPGYLSDYVADIGVVNGPYLVKTPEEYNKILETDWYKGIEDSLYEQGFKVLTLNMYFGPRNIIADKPIRTPADLVGVDIRTPPNVMWIETFKALGANPVNLAWSEVYSGLAQGVVDAAEAPLGSLWGSKLYESKKVISMTGHFKAFVGMAMGRKYWETLPEDVQKILLEEAKNAGDKLTELTLGSIEEYKDKFREQGCTIIEDVDLKAFQEKTKSVYEAFPNWTPGLYDTIQGFLR